jgi:hypothetical protein
MHSVCHVKRKGWERVWRGGNIERISVYRDGQVSIETGLEKKDALFGITLAEVRLIVNALRAKGIEIEPERERQRELAWELTKSLGAPQSLNQAEAAD